jgi:hypothetical protein
MPLASNRDVKSWIYESRTRQREIMRRQGESGKIKYPKSCPLHNFLSQGECS